MIRFTDAQIEALRELATPLAPFQRGRFLQPVAECLTGITIGDGSVHRLGSRLENICPLLADKTPAPFVTGRLLFLFLYSLVLI
jgi:hypothetical protein